MDRQRTDTPTSGRRPAAGPVVARRSRSQRKKATVTTLVPRAATEGEAGHHRRRAARSFFRPRFVRVDGLRRDHRPLGARSRGAFHRRAVADGDDRRLHGLGRARRVLARQADAARREGDEEGGAARQLRRPPRAAPRRRGALHRSAAAGPPLRRAGVAEAALRRHLPVVPADAAVVAQRDDRRARRHPAERKRRRVRDAAVPRRAGAVELSAHQPRGARAHVARRGDELRARRAEFRRGLGSRRQRPPAGWRGSLRGRPQSRRHAGQGRLPQPADRVDPVRARDRHRAARAGADRAGMDHEVLHPRSFPAEFARPVPDGSVATPSS